MKPRWQRTRDGWKTRTPNGTVEIFRTVDPTHERRWTVELDGTLFGTYFTNSEAIKESEEILTVPK